MRLMLATALLALVLVAAGCSGSNSDTSASSGSSEATHSAVVEESEGDFSGLVDFGGDRKMYLGLHLRGAARTRR
jgi:ABC-type glycerol-3-phosphate transport system substrate-binding protein